VWGNVCQLCEGVQDFPKVANPTSRIACSYESRASLYFQPFHVSKPAHTFDCI